MSILSASRYSDAIIVKPRTACRLLSVGNTRLYQLIKTGELDSFLDGRSRKITVASIERYISRRLAHIEESAP